MSMVNIEGYISAVIPSFNAEKYIEDTLTSLLTQTQSIDEIIVVDNGSQDQTLRVIEDFKRKYDPNLKIYSLERNYGASYARNYGVNKASGEFILFMDSDDIAEPDLLEKELNKLKDMSSLSCACWVLAHSAYSQINESGTEIGGIHHWKQVGADEILGYEFIRNYVITTSGVLVKKIEFIKAGGFNTSLACSEDWDLWLRLAAAGGFAYVDEPLIRVRRHGENISAKICKMLDGEKNVLKRYDLEFIQQAVYKRKLSDEQNLIDFVSILFRLGYWEEGYKKIKNALVSGHYTYNTHFYLGVYYLYKKDYEKAGEEFLKTVSLKQSHGAALNNLGAINGVMGKYSEAEAYLKNVLELYPDYCDALLNLKLIRIGGNITPQKVRFTWRELREVLLKYNE
ncbi:MAG: glycosyltransferase [Clostridia bacterium]|nr:glycosyltransferase [Clostridia bacterium]